MNKSGRVLLVLLPLAFTAFTLYRIVQEDLKEEPPKTPPQVSASPSLEVEEASSTPVSQDTQYDLEGLPDTLIQDIPLIWHRAGRGFARRFWGLEVEYDAFLIPVTQVSLELYFKNKKGNRYGSFKNLEKSLAQQRKELIFATNAGIFKPDYTPQGLYVEDGRIISPLNLKKGKGNFYMRPNGVFYTTYAGEAHLMLSALYPKVKDSVRFATQSGPILLYRSKINPLFKPESTSRYLRSGVGLINEEWAVFLISRQKVNFYEFARIFRDRLLCQEALYLDGAISKMNLPALGRQDSTGNFSALIAVTQAQ